MTQFIVGIGNEYSITAFLIGAFAAIVIPWYFLRPNRSRFNNTSRSTGRTPSTSSQASTNMDGDSAGNLRQRHEHIDNSGGTGYNDRMTGDTATSTSNNGSHFNVRVKYHETDRQFYVSNSTTVMELKRLAFPEDFNQGKRIRLIFCGRVLHDDSLDLGHYNIRPNSVLHCQISDAQTPNTSTNSTFQDQGPDLDLGHVLIPTIALGLLVVWFGVFTYSELFTSTSVTVLAVLTILFGMFVFLT